MTPMDLLAAYDRVREIWDCMTPHQQAVALLRMEGCTDVQIAAILGLKCAGVVSMRMTAAKIRILRKYPELRLVVADRYKSRGQRSAYTRRGIQSQYVDPGRILERGFLCPAFDPNVEEDR
jgi:hypothetical protein